MRSMVQYLVENEGAIVLQRYDNDSTSIPDGCVIATDEHMAEWLVYAPAVRQEMREHCPICSAGVEHEH